MGVYNPLAEMPRSCVACDSRYSCPLSSPTAHGIFGFRHPECPLVEVSVPHGRLGDLDALAHIIGQHSLNWEYGEGVSDCWDDTIAAPTVLEAEGKDDGRIETLSVLRW